MEITIRNLQKKIPINPKRIKKTILKIFSSEAKEKKGELTVSFVDDKQIKSLNSKYLGKNSSTDVLAFDIGSQEDELLADIIISTETALRNAAIFNTSPSYEVNLYAAHGVLHLLGYNDRTPQEKALMRKKEKKYADI